MPWPFSGLFAPLQPGVVDVDGEPCGLTVTDCGALRLPSGRLYACDPFTSLDSPNLGLVLELPPGDYPVRATIADVSGKLDGSHLREAYLTLVLREGQEARHEVYVPPGQPLPEPEHYYGVGVDSAAVSFCDLQAVARCMPPDPETWHDQVFDDGTEESWFELMDSPEHVGPGLANVTFPLATEGENIVISRSGWGDGLYPLQLSYDADGRLLAVHIDLEVVGTFRDGDGEGEGAVPQPAERADT